MIFISYLPVPCILVLATSWSADKLVTPKFILSSGWLLGTKQLKTMPVKDYVIIIIVYYLEWKFNIRYL